MIKWRLDGLDRLFLVFIGFKATIFVMGHLFGGLSLPFGNEYLGAYLIYATAALMNFLLVFVFLEWGLRDATISGVLVALALVHANFTVSFVVAHPVALVAIVSMLWIGHISATVGAASAMALRAALGIAPLAGRPSLGEGR